MNIATILGIIFGVAVLSLATFLTTATPLVFVNPAGLAIVLGGTAAATLICHPLRELMRVFGVFLTALGQEEVPVNGYVDHLVKIAKTVSQQGSVALEKELPRIENQFLKHAVQMLVDGYKNQEIKEILDTRIEQYYEQETSAAGIYRNMARFSPAFGIIGTLIGLIGMMQAMGSDMAALGPAMATALTTTLYGVLFANLIYLPIAVKVEKRVEEHCILMAVIRDGIMLINERTPSAIVLDKLRAYLPPRKWASLKTTGTVKGRVK